MTHHQLFRQLKEHLLLPPHVVFNGMHYARKRFSYHTKRLNVGKHLYTYISREYGHFLCSARLVGMTSMSTGGHWVFWSSNCWQENRHLSRRIHFRNLA